MRSFWLLPLVLALALASWISGIDATGTAGQTWFLWSVTAFAAAIALSRLLLRAG